MFHRLSPERVGRITGISFEHSPGRGDLRFTGDRSAFDVFVTYISPAERRGFFGIEVKYHEDLTEDAAEHRARYDEVADAMGCFVANREALRKKPIQQIWRDHLLAGALVADGDGFDEGTFLFLAPMDNGACWRAVAKYRAMLTNEASFAAWTLEQVVDAIEENTSAAWVAELFDRYLAFDRVDACVLRESFRGRCPSCGDDRGLPLFFGEPTMSAVRMANRGEVALGGCVVATEAEPTWRCVRCGHEW